MAKSLRKSQVSMSISKYWPESILRHCCIQNVIDGVQIRV